MIDEEISNLIAIDTFIRQKQPFAVYRIPGEKTPRLLTQAGGTVRLICADTTGPIGAALADGRGYGRRTGESRANARAGNFSEYLYG